LAEQRPLVMVFIHAEQLGGSGALIDTLKTLVLHGFNKKDDKTSTKALDRGLPKRSFN
jgi:hypothetical protein